MRILGVDYGTVRTGLALSDPAGLLASPAVTLATAPADSLAPRLLQECHRLGAEKIVIGLPRHLDGRDGTHAPAVRRLAEQLMALADSPPVVFWEERFSSQAAERALREAGHSSRASRHRVDAASAAIILQNYLDAQQLRCDGILA